jgi:hypothetical protein
MYMCGNCRISYDPQLSLNLLEGDVISGGTGGDVATEGGAATDGYVTTEGDVTSKVGVAPGNGLVPVSALVGTVVGIILPAAVAIVIIVVVLQMYWMRRYGYLSWAYT